jgi:hypothetical protein
MLSFKSMVTILSSLLFAAPIILAQSKAPITLLYGQDSLTEEITNGIEVNGNIYLYGSQFISGETINSNPFCISLDPDNEIKNQSEQFPQRLGKLHNFFHYNSEWLVLSSNKKSKVLYISRIAIDSGISFHGIADSLVLPEGFLALSNWKLYGHSGRF